MASPVIEVENKVVQPDLTTSLLSVMTKQLERQEKRDVEAEEKNKPKKIKTKVLISDFVSKYCEKSHTMSEAVYDHFESLFKGDYKYQMNKYLNSFKKVANNYDGLFDYGSYQHWVDIIFNDYSKEKCNRPFYLTDKSKIIETIFM